MPKAKDESLYNVHNYIALLDHVGKAVERVDPNPPIYQPHRATYLKLALVTAYARTFLPIARRHAPVVRYLDVLSASGLSRPGGDKHPVPGSAIFVPLCHQDFRLVATPPQTEFDGVWAFDGAKTNLDALKRRIDGLGGPHGYRLPPTTYLPGDINDTLPRFVETISDGDAQEYGSGKKAPLYLAFVDNEGLDVHMSTIEAIQRNIRADLVVHVNSHGIYRLVKQHQATANEAAALTKFFGDDSWKAIESAEDVGRIYRDRVQAVTGQDLQVSEPVHIRGRHYMFTMVFCARKTGAILKDGGPGWMARIQAFIEACNRLDVEDIDPILNRVVKGQTGLDKFGF